MTTYASGHQALVAEASKNGLPTVFMMSPKNVTMKKSTTKTFLK